MPTSAEVGHLSLSVEEITKQQIVKLFTQEDVERYWDVICEELNRNPEPLSHYYTLESLRQRAMDGRLHIWAVCPPPEGEFTLILFTEHHETDAGRQLRVVWASGEGAIRALNCIGLVLQRFAYETGCVRIFATGRRGWVRALRIFGATDEGVCMSAPVEKIRSN